MLYIVQIVLSLYITSQYPDVLYFCPPIKYRQNLSQQPLIFMTSTQREREREREGSCFDQVKTDVQKAINVGSLSFFISSRIYFCIKYNLSSCICLSLLCVSFCWLFDWFVFLVSYYVRRLAVCFIADKTWYWF